MYAAVGMARTWALKSGRFVLLGNLQENENKDHRDKDGVDLDEGLEHVAADLGTGNQLQPRVSDRIRMPDRHAVACAEPHGMVSCSSIGDHTVHTRQGEVESRQ